MNNKITINYSDSQSRIKKIFRLEIKARDLPGDPVVKTLHIQCGGAGSIPGWRTRIPHATEPKEGSENQRHNMNINLAFDFSSPKVKESYVALIFKDEK